MRLDVDPEAPPARPAHALNRRGLLIEPHELSRIALHNMLAELGLAVNAIASIDEMPPEDVVEMDLLMIACGGNQQETDAALSLMRTILERYTLPVIALISSSDETQLARFTKAGARYCLSKPPQRHDLLQALRGCLSTTDTAAGTGVFESERGERAQGFDRALPLAGKTCLAADDHPVNLQLITHQLADLGADVIEAVDGAGAVQAAREHAVDMAFLDVHMPGVNGLEAARQIQALDPGHKLPIVALTADAAERNQRDIHRAGIERCLIKPVNDDRLRAVVAELLNGKPAATSIVHAGAAPSSDAAWPVRDQAQALRISGGSENIAAKLFDELCNELPSALADMRASYDRNDWQELWQQAHRLHGAAAVCGVPALYHALAELQPSVSLEDTASIEAHLRRVADEVSRLLAHDGVN
jgi:two-component system sensor histidine kinase BarA